MNDIIGLVAIVVAVVAFGFLLRPKRFVIYEWEVGILLADGKATDVLSPGRHVLWPFGRDLQVQRVMSREQMHASGPIDVLTADRFSLRLATTSIYRIVDAKAALNGLYYQKLQIALSEALTVIAGERSLDALIADRAALGAVVLEQIKTAAPECEVSAVTISGLTLPPEIRKLLTEVERAKLEGLAALERARGEHAALRSLANAARLLKDNPDLLRLRTLQAVSPTGKGATLVLGADAVAGRTGQP